MKKGKRILLLSLLSLIAIGILLRLSQIRNVKEPIVIDNEVRGSETLNCNGTFEGVQTSIEVFELDREWYLIDDDNYNTLNIVLDDIQVSEDLLNEVVFSYQIGAETGVLDYNEQEESWSKSLNIDGFEPSEYEVILTGEISECDLLFSKNDNITVSYPVYVAWTMDWEGFDVEQKYLDSIRDISNDYRIPITHFFNPYIYLNLRDSSSKYLTDWVLSRQNAGDSIGLHLHMNNKMVEAAGVTPKTDISWGGWAKDGQDIPNTVYEYDEYKKIVNWARLQFEKNSLPNPTMFRAGAWFIDEENLRVLEDLGFELDSSGRTYKVYGDNKLEGPWDLESTTQPYRLNSSNQNIVNNPDMDLWEFPNNGADSWAYSSDQLIQNFKDNYNGGIANSRKVVTYLSHPHWFNVDEPKIINLLDYTQNFGIVNDRGPVVYTTLDQIEIN